jgi:uncharacterized protein (TIGR01777 family)
VADRSRSGSSHVIVTGGTGFIGSALIPALVARGWRVSRLSRSRGEIHWDWERGILDRSALEGADAVVHLAGESVSRRWTTERRRLIRESRVRGTRLLGEQLAALERKPRVLVSASAIGYYGHRGDEEIDESTDAGADFLARVAREWEAATSPAREAGIRVVTIRTGLVLDPCDGALARLLVPFRLGLGGPMGSGRQWWSWITIDDLVGLYLHAIDRERIEGAMNATAPHPVRNEEFARTLGRVIGRPTWVTAPAFALRLVLGREMADAMLLGGARILPRRAVESGYPFRDPDLEPALRRLLDARA